MEQSMNRRDVVIPEEIMQKWQDITNLLSQIVNIPSALIMRLVDEDIEAFVVSTNEDNPYSRGDKEEFFNSGLYCETVVRKNQKLLVPNALKDDNWKDNPDVALNMISYLGYPISYPDGVPFGTICVLDRKENHFNGLNMKLLENFRDIVQAHLGLIFLNAELGEENRNLNDFLKELKVLRGIVPICCHCKKIRDEDGRWQEVDYYVQNHSEAEFSHGICPDCQGKYY